LADINLTHTDADVRLAIGLDPAGHSLRSSRQLKERRSQ
jgi:hypothetical protein